MSTLILSHADSDGLCSAALLLAKFPEAEVFFTKPVSLLADLKTLSADKILISDIATNKRDSTAIMELIKNKKADITWFDHHPIVEKSMPCKFVSGEGCSSELVYKYFQKELDPDLNFLAVYGAIGDYTDHTEFIKSKLADWDSRSLHFEASILFLGIKEEKFSAYNSKRKIVTALSKGKSPSEIPGLLDAAKKAVEREFELYSLLKKKVQISGNVAYANNIPHFGFRGQSALFAATIGNKPIGISVFENKMKKITDITMRSRKPFELNKICEQAAESVNGSGGGHPAAAGARIPLGTLEIFLKKVNELI